MRVRWSDRALENLHSSRRFVARRSHRYADRLVDRLFTKAAILADQPYFGSMMAEFEYEGLRELLVDSHRIVYRIDSDECVIIAVIHSSQQVPSDLADRDD